MTKKSEQKASDSNVSAKLHARRSSNRLLPIGLSAFGFLLVLGYVVILAMQWSGEEGTSGGPSPTSTPGASAEPVERSVSGKSEAEDRKDATAAVQKSLALAYEGDGKSITDRLKAVEEGDFNVVGEGFEDSLRMGDSRYGDNETYRINTYQSFMSIAELTVKETSDDTFEPVGEYSEVYLDQESGRAFVPMTIFSGTSSLFSIEVVYVDGAWIVDPYSLVQQVRNSAIISQQG